MKKIHFLLTLAAGLVGGTLSGCSTSDSDVAKGPGSETTNGIFAYVNGDVAPYAAVALRKVDHRADFEQVESAIVVADTFADSKGMFNLDVPMDGDYRLTVTHNGSAYTKVVSSESYAGLDTVKLSATAVMKGEVDIPDGSNAVWVGVLGTDILVQTDANGVFVIPSIPAGDSLKLYFVSDDSREVLDEVGVYFTPAEFAYENYKAPAVIPEEPEEEPKVDPENPEDTVVVPVDTVKKIVLLQEDGKSAAGANVALRKADFRVEELKLQNNSVLPDTVADQDGKFIMAWPDSGSYRLTVTSKGYSFTKVYDAADLAKIDTLILKESATISSKVTLSGDERFAWVGVYGMDMLVQTSSVGSYVLPALPAGDSLKLYFVHKDSVEPFVELQVAPLTSGNNYLNVSKMLYDFEEANSRWYLSVDTLWKGSTFYSVTGKNDNPYLLVNHLEENKERGSKVFHTKYAVAKDPYAWVLVGTGMEEVRNFAAIDSIEFYAKGNGKVRLALENWESYNTNAKAASGWVALDSTWSRIVLTPADLCFDDSEVSDCDGSWDSVKNQVKQLHIFPNGGDEIFIDDLKIYGALF